MRGSASVTVTSSPLVGLEVIPATGALEVNETLTLRVIGTFADGASADVVDGIEWSSNDVAVATVAAGVVTGVAPGQVTITAQSGDVSADAQLTVNVPTIVALAVEGPSGTVAAGATVQLVAQATLSSGSTLAITADVDWSSSAPTVATVGNTMADAGQVTGVGAGRATITASHAPTGLTATRDVTVAAPILTGVEVSPAVADADAGDFVFFAAAGVFSDGSRQDFTRRVTWRSSNTTVAQVSNEQFQNGRTLAATTGTSTISAFDEVSGLDSATDGRSAVLTVRAAGLRSIQIEPQQDTVPAGRTLTLLARGNFSDGTTQVLTDRVEWRTNAPLTATVEGGVVTGLVQGTAIISAFDPTTGIESGTLSATIQVGPPLLTAMQITPTAPEVVQSNRLQIDAIGSFSDGSSRSVRNEVTWRSLNTVVLIALSGGALDAVSGGQATVEAIEPTTGISDSVTVTVVPLRQLSVSITPAQAFLPVSSELGFRVQASFNNGDIIDITDTATLTTSDPQVLAIGRSGNRRNRVFAEGAGTGRLTATDSVTGNSGVLDVTVSSTLALASLSVMGPPEIDVGQSAQLMAMGTYGNGDVYELTHGVIWSSSDLTRLRVADGLLDAGIATGVTTGTPAVSIRSGTISSMPRSIDVVGRAVWPGPTEEVDAQTVTVGSASVAAALIGATGRVIDIDVVINFRKTDGSCASPASGDAFHRETSFSIVPPSGSAIVLAPVDTWSGGTETGDVEVTFDDGAASAPSGIPQTGRFQPNGALSALNGINPTGTWALEAGDDALGDPLCVNSFAIVIKTD